jgi:catechol 2,3-dioxygenase-like lactoylglutathione lyase family enzyme
VSETRLIQRVLETAVHCSDLARAREFYIGVLGLAPMLENERIVALDAGAATVLLLFQRGASDEATQTPGGVVPGHGSHGTQHFAFAVEPEHLEAIVERLDRAGVEVESRVSWPSGGLSVYFRDPDGHSVELATPGVWPVY